MTLDTEVRPPPRRGRLIIPTTERAASVFGVAIRATRSGVLIA